MIVVEFSTHFLIKLIARNPVYGILLGLIGSLVFSYFGWDCYKQTLVYARGPTSLSLADAIRGSAQREIYVRLQDVVTENCARGYEEDRYVYIPLRSSHEKIGVVAFYDSPTKCRALEGKPIQGTMEPMFGRMHERLIKAGLDLPEDVRSICTNCGEANSRLGVIVCTVLVIVSLLLIPLSPMLHKKYSTPLRAGPYQPINPK